LKKIQDKQAAAAAAAASTSASPAASAGPSIPVNTETAAVFKSGEKPMKTPRPKQKND
jgi:hypothetical protein